MSDPLSLFLTVASDLYRTDSGYRREIDAEAKDGLILEPRRPSTIDRLDEVDWLIRNGMNPAYACEQVGWQLTKAQARAHQWAHPVHTRLTRQELPASDNWAKSWLAGQVAA